MASQKNCPSALRTFLDHWRRSRRQSAARRPRFIEALESRRLLSVNILTFHDDLQSTGVNSNEVQLTPANVTLGSFGKLFATTVDGQVYAEPLVDTGITIAAGPNTTSGSAGVHDVVFVATEHDSLYAIDASVAGGKILWKRTFLDASNPSNNTLGATSITTVPSADTGSSDINPEIGITGTPVIDPTTNIIYLSVKTKEMIGGVAHYVQRLHAIKTSDGTDVATPYLIGDSTSTTNNTQIYVYGTGDGNTIDPYNGTGNKVVQFNALREAQRAAITLENGSIYVAWASHGDNGPYHGWVLKWDVSSIITTGFKLTGVFNTSPNNGLAGVWQGGGRLVFESDGSAFYFETGNGSGSAPSLNAQGFPTNANYKEALVKMTSDSTTTPTSQGPNGWGLKVLDYFIPYNVNALDGADSDFGSGAPIILPDSAGIPGHPHLMLAAGKEGKIYVIDRDNMGKYTVGNDNVLNAVPNGSGNNTPPVMISGALSTAAYYNGTIYWTSGYSGHAFAYKINSNGTLSVVSQTDINNFGYLPGSAVVSSNGATNGIVWLMDRNLNEIHAYDANTLATELWNSGQKAGGADALGAVVKFAVPTVANGEVYVGTSNSLVVYGLTPPAGSAPNAPALAAAPLSGTSINLTWSDSSVPPNIATSYLVEDSTDGANFTQITTAPAGATSLAIGSLNVATTYFFRIRGSNGVGTSGYSNIVSATTPSQTGGLDFSGGFVGATSQMKLNGSSINGTHLRLTDGGTNENHSAFSTTALDITHFQTQFTFQSTSGANTADGFTFTIQNTGPNAVGNDGSGLGYANILKSVAVKFDLYNNNGEGFSSTGLYINGALPTNIGSISLAPAGVDFHNGHVFQVTMAYDGANLGVTILDTVNGQSATNTYAINISSTIVSATGFVGFTGATGKLTTTQDIISWIYSPTTASVSPNAPSGLGATPASATSVNLTWTNNSTNQTGFHLDRANDAGFTQNLITETLPATVNSFTDIATGLAPGSTFFYRLRAFNSAGDSGNSNVASVTIPIAPPKPTNQIVTNVTTSEIDISWQDNAGHLADGYHILRAVNHGAFTQIASLPPTSRTAPSPYDWSDTGLTPGNFYEYHIVAYNVSGSNDFAGVNATTITTAPTGLAASSISGAVNLSWTAPAGALQYNIYRGTASGAEATTPLATITSGTTYSDTSVLAGVTYYYIVTAVNANINEVPVLPAESAASNEAAAVATSPTSGLPAGWADLDIGSPGKIGSATVANGVWTLSGGGADIWGTTDQFNYASESVSGNLVFIARVATITNTNSWTKAGVMFRNGTASNAAFIDVVVSSSQGISMQWRAAAGGNPSSITVAGKTAPQWVKLVRNGDSFTGYYSGDGTSWIQIGSSVTVVMATPTAGLAITAHDNTKLATATIDNVSITAGPHQLTGTAIGTAGSFQNSGNTIANVFDGNLNTFFDGPTANGNWVGLDLGSAQTITQIAFAPRSGFGSRMTGGVFQASNVADFSSGVTTLYTVSGTPPSGSLTAVNVSPGGTFRYIRYLAPNNGWGNIAEFVVYGS